MQIDQESDYRRFKGVSSPIAVRHDFIIDDEFVHVDQFQELVDAIDSSNETDIVVIKLTTPGGSFQSIIPLLDAIKNSPCHVHCEIISDVSSAGTFIALAADTVRVNEYVSIMHHNCSYGAHGSARLVSDQVKHHSLMIERIVREAYQDFFSQDEIQNILNDREIWMDGTEFMDRWTTRNNLRDARATAPDPEYDPDDVAFNQ